MKFEELEIEPKIIQVLNKLGYDEMLPIQEKVIPVMESGKDCFVQSRTGSGKTIAYGLPIIESLQENEREPQALILAPTRELAVQITKELTLLGTYKRVKCLSLIGKQAMTMQAEDLKQRTHIVVGTPGRVFDHLEQGNFVLDQVKYLVLDEADALLNPDFYEKIGKILAYFPHEPQICLVSATKNTAAQDFMDTHMADFVSIRIDTKNEQIEQYALQVPEEQKLETMVQVLLQTCPQACVIFCATQQRVREVTQFLRAKGVSVAGIHAGLDQAERFSVLDAFKQGKIRLLVATDVLARGVDIEKVDFVLNYDAPSTQTLSIHRMGRSGRIHQKGKVLTFYVSENSYMAEQKKWVLQPVEDEAKAWKTLQECHRQVTDKAALVRKDVTCLYLNVGKRKKIRPGDIVGAILHIDGLEMDDIGVIRVQDHQSFVDIYHNKADLVLKGLHTIKKKSVRVEISHA